MVNKSLAYALVSALSFGAAHVYRAGCPTRQVEREVGPLGCLQGGYYTTYANHWAPNATRIQGVGEEALRRWNTSAERLNQRFNAQYPKERISSILGHSPSGSCLTDGATRALYKKMTSRISSFVGNLTETNCLEKAKTASELRTQARQTTRSRMCNQYRVKILEARDRAEYGMVHPDFIYMVGKYAQRAATKCINATCNIMDATCNAIIYGAQKTNRFYNWVSRFFY